MATNLCLNELRDRKTKPVEPPSDVAPELSRESDVAERIMTWDLLRGLDRRSQELAIYVYVDGMTHAEAAEVAGVSERTVRYSLNRFILHGRKTLGAQLQEEI